MQAPGCASRSRSPRMNGRMRWPPCSRASARLRVAPDEIVIADDGSGPATQAVIAAFIAALDGARTAGRRSLTRDFASHACAISPSPRPRSTTSCSSTATWCCTRNSSRTTRACARPGSYTQGVRVLADARLTPALIDDPATAHARSRAARDSCGAPICCTRRACPRCSGGAGNGLVAIKSCNQGFWRDDLVRVNGFDEDFVGWGPEDKELCARLEELGCPAPDAAVRRHRLSPAPCAGIARSNCPAISRGSRPRAASARCAANTGWTRICPY